MAVIVAVLVMGAAVAPPAPPATPIVSHVAITVRNPAPDMDETLGVIGGHVVVGVHDSSAICQLATVQPTSLRVVSEVTTSCDNPLLAGEYGMPVESVTPVGSQIGQVRIAVRNRATGTFRLGPVVMRYGNFSDTRPEWTYGGGYLWLYDVGTAAATVTPKLPAEVLRISLASGAVLATVPMPAMYRVMLAADEDGLWIGAGVETVSGSKPPLLYFLAVGATHLKLVQHGDASSFVNWLVAAGHTVWANVTTDRQLGAIVTETFATPSSKPLSITDAKNTPSPSDIGEGAFDEQPVLDVSGFGLVAAKPGWIGTVGTGGASSETVVKLDPTMGGFSTVVSFPTQEGVVEANVAYGGALYCLSPQEWVSRRRCCTACFSDRAAGARAGEGVNNGDSVSATEVRSLHRYGSAVPSLSYPAECTQSDVLLMPNFMSMKMRMKISKGGQISIPATIRHRWGTRTVAFEDLGDRIVIEPAADDPIAAAEGALAAELGEFDVKRLRRSAREDERIAGARRGR